MDEPAPVTPRSAALDSPGDTYGAGDAASRRTSRWLLSLARVVWVALALILVGSYTISLPGTMAERRTTCADPACETGGITPATAAVLQSAGISADLYAVHVTVLATVAAAAFVAVAATLFWKKSVDPWHYSSPSRFLCLD